MIHSVWKPYYNKGKIVYYEKINNEDLFDLKGKTAYKVIWSCDNQKCNYQNKLHSISACHLTKPKLSPLIQICRPCQCTGEGNGRFGDNRKWDDLYDDQKVKKLKKIYSNKWKGEHNPSKKDEIKIKKNQNIIDETFIKKIVSEKNFILNKINKIDGKKSQFEIECKYGHKSEKIYLNFIRKDQNFICQKCFYESISLNLTDEDMVKIEKYKKQVRALTAKNYKLFKNIINPENLKIGKKEYHLDHKYSIYEGFKNKVDYRVISAKENLQIIPFRENLSKQAKCNIDLDKLLSLTEYLLIK